MAPPPPPPPASPSPTVYSELDAGLPIVMLPVRLETRYFDVDPAIVELRVRIFPSAAHVTTPRPGIDPSERDQTIAYWRTRRTSGDDASATEAAWQRMVQLFGDPRAQYLRRLLTPAVDATGALTFPDVPLNPPPDETTILTSTASDLPTRFFVVGYGGHALYFQVAGLTVPEAVAVGPHGDPEAIRWQSDFTVAELIGLGVRVRIARGEAQALTRLLVFGVREGVATVPLPADAGAALLETLIAEHAREQGVALLPAGTSTNHTPEARVAPPFPATGLPPAPSTDGARLASALGVDAAVFAAASGTAAVTEPQVEAMHTALWPATFGYFFDQVMSPVLGEAAIFRARVLFQKFVRPRGPFPTLTLGGQPYGVLPVSALAGWRADASTEDPVARVLAGLRADWLAASAHVPRLGASSDAGADLMAILAQSPISTRWLARTLQANVVAQGMFNDVDPTHFQTVVDQLRRASAAAELAPVGLTGAEPRALDFLFDANSFRLNVALVAPSTADRAAPLAVNYIDAVAKAAVAPLKNHEVVGAAPRTLLYLLLRHATLLVMERTADRFGALGLTAAKEKVFVERQATTVWARLDAPIAALGNQSLAQVFTGGLPTNTGFAELAAHRQALAVLTPLGVGELERLTAEAIDAASHRLDAWITALASERLSTMRASAPRDAHLGAYAWVDAPPVPAVLAKDGEPPTLDADSEGFMHAPGLEHARTAAVLRAAFIARQQAAAEAPLAIDLSSERVRDAQRLLEGVRNGASLAALLGERIERWMAEFGFGPQLPAVRAQFSLVDGSGRTRIDGVKAAEAWWGVPPAGLLPVAARLAALTDALADLLLAEAVHQQSSGNPGRAQPALAALDTGVTMPGELDVVRTEAEATSATWRLVLPLAPDAVTAWAAGIIGDPAQLSATVTREGAAPRTITLAALGMTAVGLRDFVKAGPDAPALAARLAEEAGGGTVTYAPALATALVAAAAIDNLLRGARLLQPSDIGATREALPGFERRSQQKEWLHDLGRVRPSIAAVDTLDFVLRGRNQDPALRFVAAAPGLNIVSIGALPPGPPAGGLLIDGWTERTPGLQATTGIAMHYDAPRSRAPQAILIVTPPDPAAGWGIEAVQASLFETADLAHVRMVRPADVHGSFLPALYFADNLAAETVATDFLSLGVVAQFKDA